MRRMVRGALALGALTLGLYVGTYAVRAQDAISDAEQILILVNQRRAEVGLPPLSQNAALDKAAQAWAKYMATYNYFNHQGRDGSTPMSRATAAGYRGVKVGENIARGFTNPLSVMTSWMQSAGHRANILNPDYTDLGVGIATSRSGIYWVQCFGASGAPEPAAPVALSPTIAAIEPYHTRMGEEVVITGQRFGDEEGSVTFTAGLAGEIVSWRDDRIVVTVPYGAGTGMVYVQNGAGASAGAYLYVQYPLTTDPVIVRIDPGSASPRTTVRIYGRNLGAEAGAVTFGGIPAPISQWSTSGLYVDVLVPAAAATGAVVVRRADGAASNPFSFTVPGTVPNPNPPPASDPAPAPTPPPAPSPLPQSNPLPQPGPGPSPTLPRSPALRAPSLVALSTSSGSPGDVILLIGSWYGQTPRGVTFNGVAAAILRWDEMTLVVAVPATASSGPVQMRTDSGASNTLPFTITRPVVQPIPISRPQPSSVPLRGRPPGWR